MRILIDTHVLLWSQGFQKRLTPTVRELLEEPEQEVFFSAASIWEIAIKSRLRKADFKADPRLVLEAARATGFVELPVSSTVASAVADLPMHHADPFDRLLVAQALDLPARLLTLDKQLAPYSELVIVV
jgi:PIN domain nuclease of toxin-antitoxin system